MEAQRRLHDNEIEVSESLVRALLRSQLPDLAELPLRPAQSWGTDHAMWRLGEEHVVRLPRIDWAAGQVRMERTLLPKLAEALPVRVPRPVALGEPGSGYPFEWGVHSWIPGDDADIGPVDDRAGLSADLAATVRALRSLPVPGADAPPGRGRRLAELDADARSAIESAAPLVDTRAALDVWTAGLEAPPHAGAPVWSHGDLEGNCLVADGRLSGIIDWGLAGVGDPAADVQVAWSPLLTAESRADFLARVEADAATIARAKGLAVLQACAALPYYVDTHPPIVRRSIHKLGQLGVEVRVR